MLCIYSKPSFSTVLHLNWVSDQQITPKPPKLVICTFWKWVNECWLMEKPALKNNVIVWFMSDCRKAAAAVYSRRLTRLHRGFCETDKLPLPARYSITSVQLCPEETHNNCMKWKICVCLMPNHHLEQIVKLKQISKQIIVPMFQWNESELHPVPYAWFALQGFIVWACKPH